MAINYQIFPLYHKYCKFVYFKFEAADKNVF